ncbi:CRAL-TRIO domain containing protein [Oryctes borbonicus]|uniref:CRAL-TRIO domain containing protein n=1 Tax=Oryctes borbonicus TaxID=1629725 RepID=A0A0T6ATN3_9SCAR|nr:CRAL-TRIO domain containing protein [Oryctes borbonicus]
MSIRPLTKELEAKAKSELNEEPKRVQEDIKYIKEWLGQQKHIKARIEDQWLLTFLRGCKFSLERTKEKLDMYYAMRTIIPEFFSQRDPFEPSVQELLSIGAFVPLVKYGGRTDPKYLIFRSTVFDPEKHTAIDAFKINLMINDILMNEDDQMVIGGICVVTDMGNMSVAQMMSYTPSVMKKVMTCFEEGYPTRPKEIHFYKIPSFFEAMFNMVKPFMKEKMLKRVFVHKKSDLSSLQKHIPKAILPAEYGGDAGPIQDMIDFWKAKIESYAGWFKEDYQYKTDESLRPGKPKTSSELFGIEGSFRKLNVD